MRDAFNDLYAVRVGVDINTKIEALSDFEISELYIAFIDNLDAINCIVSVYDWISADPVSA